MFRHLACGPTLQWASAVLLLAISGCDRDYEAELDAKVTQQWMRPGMFVDAIEYLESGGHYHNSDDDPPGAQNLDQQAILPFLKALREEFGQDLYAILVEADEDAPANDRGDQGDAAGQHTPPLDELAWGFVMKLPNDEANRKRFEDYLESARQDFPGMILEQWGHEWISLDFIDEEQAQFVREAEAAAKAAAKAAS